MYKAYVEGSLFIEAAKKIFYSRKKFLVNVLL